MTPTTGYFDTAGRLVVPGISVTTNNASFTTLYASGRVGIGTNSPSVNLDVKSNGKVDIVAHSTSSAADQWSAFTLRNDLGDIGYFWTNSSGSDPFNSSRLMLQATDGSPGISLLASKSDGDIRFFTGGAVGYERMRIAPNGNVGIGTTNPTTALEVSGTISATALSVGSPCSSPDVQTFNSSGTWTKPSCGIFVKAECWGGGGGGARQNGTRMHASGGGGGGYDKVFLPASSVPLSVGITVGAGGAGLSSNGPGNAGGNSLFGSYLIAYGGAGGLNSTEISNVEGGSGGLGVSSGGSGGTSGFAGENAGYGGGGGGGAFNDTGSNPPVRSGGTSLYGGHGGNSGNNASAATAPGGGGGGGKNTSSGGANGRCIVTTY